MALPDNDRYILREVADFRMLIDRKQKGVLTYIPPLELDEIGARMWKAHAEGRSDSEIALEIAEAYEVDKEDVEKDVQIFFNELKKNGIEI